MVRISSNGLSPQVRRPGTIEQKIIAADIKLKQAQTEKGKREGYINLMNLYVKGKYYVKWTPLSRPLLS